MKKEGRNWVIEREKNEKDMETFFSPNSVCQSKISVGLFPYYNFFLSFFLYRTYYSKDRSVEIKKGRSKKNIIVRLVIKTKEY